MARPPSCALRTLGALDSKSRGHAFRAAPDAAPTAPQGSHVHLRAVSLTVLHAALPDAALVCVANTGCLSWSCVGQITVRQADNAGGVCALCQPPRPPANCHGMPPLHRSAAVSLSETNTPSDSSPGECPNGVTTSLPGAQTAANCQGKSVFD